MIPLTIDRFDEDKRILALKETEGDRYLFIGFGEKEAAEIGRAMRFEPASFDVSRATWMEMVEHRGAKLDAVAITDLVDGGFRASVQITQDSRSFDLSARPADAIAWAASRLIPILAAEDALSLSGTSLDFSAVEFIRLGMTPKPRQGNVGVPVATFRPLFSQRRQSFLRRSVQCFALFFALFGILMFGTTLPYLIHHMLDGDSTRVRTDLGWFVPMHGLYFLGIFIVFLLHRTNRPGRAVLEIYPFGLRVKVGRIKASFLWSWLEKPGKPFWFLPKVDGLKLKKRHLGMGGLGLSTYEKDWREGEIGKFVRRYAPQLMGVEPVDPEGGSTIF
jgi:bifunctional DNase/RNase